MSNRKVDKKRERDVIRRAKAELERKHKKKISQLRKDIRLEEDKKEKKRLERRLNVEKQRYPTFDSVEEHYEEIFKAITEEIRLGNDLQLMGYLRFTMYQRPDNKDGSPGRKYVRTRTLSRIKNLDIE